MILSDRLRYSFVLIFINCFTIIRSCDLFPDPSKEKTYGSDGWKIRIVGDPEKYIAQNAYTVKLYTVEHAPSFQRFKLYAENSKFSNNTDGSLKKHYNSGSFQLFPGDVLSVFDSECTNTISEVDEKDKREVTVKWIAPPSGSGCVKLKATVLTSNKMYGNTAKIFHEICEYVEKKEVKYMDCCACDEAKYSFIFEGLWNAESHPKDFPTSLWLTHFSDVVGGTHGKHFSFWGEGQIATPGLKQLAEWGSTRIIDSELRSKSKYFRSLVKAPGLWYPSVNANTSSTFRVDKKRNLLSLVSMLGPSPDWILGVSGHNLCLQDCSWIEKEVITLYPYDAGTDNGVTYMSIKQPSVPQEKIHKITPMYPEDERAPFYDPVGKFMNPLARLYITREKLYKKSCNAKSVSELMDEAGEIENSEEAERKECAVTNYTEWSACSVPCGQGLRQRGRQYINVTEAMRANCDRQLISKEMCIADIPKCPGEEEDEDVIVGKECKVGEWEEWSECSVSCGQGIKSRHRRFPDKKTAKQCPHVELFQREPCIEPPCTEQVTDPLCPVTGWSDWSPCNTTCGYGFKVHTRFLLANESMEYYCKNKVSLEETKRCKSPRGDCKLEMTEVKSVCMLPEETGPCHEYYERFRFEPMKGMCIPFSYGGCRGNKNNFFTQQECLDFCKPLMALLDEESKVITTPKSLDCDMTPWTEWSQCSVPCGRGIKIKTRKVIQEPTGSGQLCDPQLTIRRRCQNRPCYR